ncbi:MAG: hypothetical protein OWS74_03225, partial [Firmicutes bacterium]|nr:hypothetical protein [Bacillota bacterium]
LRHAGKTVFIAGLDLDFQENVFDAMGEMMGLADDVMKLHAVCTHCRRADAVISYRLSPEDERIVVGEDNYTALCLDCYDKHQDLSVATDKGVDTTSAR